MKKKVIIFGDENLAGEVKYYLDIDSDYEVVAFTVHKAFRKIDRFEGLPVVDFECVLEKYPPVEFDMFVAIGYRKMNRTRGEVIEQAMRNGYHLISYISSKAICHTAEIGCNAFICDGCYIGKGASIGMGCFLNALAIVGHRCKVGNNVFIAASVVIGGDVTVEDNCFIGQNTTVANGLTIGWQSFVGAASFINKSTKPALLYSGNPARKYSVDTLLVEEDYL
ncbi:MAG: acetyltransferase [Bacteroidota bacterium]|nr:acetyltransferase [Bacteroidota bacterium]